MKLQPNIPVLVIAALTLSGTASAQTRDEPVPVTVKNFQRAESDLYFGNFVKQGGFGKLFHYRTPTPIDKQDVVRMNRDTLYSGGVFDLDAGPVTVMLPPFFTTKEHGKGTGLGLYIVQSIIKKYGGTIAPASEPNNGTTFHIRFPLPRAA